MIIQAMPELPEVEVTRLSFADRIAGASVVSVTMGKPLRWALGCAPAKLAGQLVLGVRRRGKYLLIDLSDGLLGDLGHILKASGVGADIDTRWLAQAGDGDTAWPAHCPDLAALPWAQTLACGLTGGDDYELLFTAPPEHRAAVWAAAQASATPVSRVGRITPAGLRVLDPQGQAIDVSRLTSFDHFA